MPKILLVEDNADSRNALMRRLLRRGYEVTVAVDGAEAVAKALEESPDLILMDMNLPILDGWEATRAIRAKQLYKRVPIIALTAHAMSGDREKTIEAGCDDYHTKPVELTRLLSQIEVLLKRRGPVEEPRSTRD